MEILRKIRDFVRRVIKFVRSWNGIVMFPLAVVVWWLSGWVVWLIDKDASAMPPATFQAIFWPIMALFIFDAVAWFIIKVSWPNVNGLLRKFEIYKDELSIWQKVVLSLSVYFLFLFALVLLAVAIV